MGATTIRTLPLGSMLAAAIFLNYADRGMVGVAAPLIKGELHLSATAFGLVVSAFFWIYAPAQIAVGWLVDRTRVYRLFAGGVGLWGIATAATALTGGVASLVAVRVVLGVGESIGFPGVSRIVARDVPVRRRGLVNAGVSAGLALGPAFGTLAGGLVLARYGWRPMFGVFGLATLSWLLPWARLTRGHADAPVAAGSGVAFAAVLRQPALAVIALAHFTNNYGLYFLQNWLPLYLVASRGFALADMAWIAAATFAAQAAGALTAGALTDRAVSLGADEGRLRRAVMVAGTLAAAAGIASITGAHGMAGVVARLVATGFAVGVSTSGLYVISQIFAGPRAAGRWVGAQNAVGNLAGILGPIITGVLIDATGSYATPFLLAAGIVAAGAALWALVLPRIAPVAWTSDAATPT